MQHLRGRFELIARLASGHVGELHLARLAPSVDLQSNPRLAGMSVLAVKVLKSQLASNEKFIELLMKERAAAVEFQHDNAVRIVEVSDPPDPMYVAMELANAQPLSAVLQRASLAKIEIQRTEILCIALAAARALYLAHTTPWEAGAPSGILHAGISPHSILVTYDGSVKVLGVGLGRSHLAVPASNMRLAYRAPELIERTGTDRRADIYSLGLVVHDALAQKKASFKRRSVEETEAAVLAHELPPLSSECPGLSPKLDAIVNAMTARARGERPKSFGEIIPVLLAELGPDEGTVKASIASRMLGLFTSEARAHQKMVDAILRPRSDSGRQAVPRARSSPPRATPSSSPSPRARSDSLRGTPNPQPTPSRKRETPIALIPIDPPSQPQLKSAEAAMAAHEEEIVVAPAIDFISHAQQANEKPRPTSGLELDESPKWIGDSTSDEYFQADAEGYLPSVDLIDDRIMSSSEVPVLSPLGEPEEPILLDRPRHPPAEQAPPPATSPQPQQTQRTDELALGALIGGKYRVLTRIAEGGMGVIYKVEHELMKKELALKLLRPEISMVPHLARRFEREARAVCQLDHPNIVRVTDFGREPDGTLFLVMEFLEGESLLDRLATGAPLTFDGALDIIEQILLALDHAHRHEVVHRDLKPDNVMLVEREGILVAKILDFGIAKAADVITDPDAPPLTQTGMVFGTPQYMSPEQAAGETVDGRADLYTVGVMLYQILTKRLPFDGDSASAVLARQITQPPPPLNLPISDRELADQLEAVVHKALAKERGQRYATPADFREAIRDLRRRIRGPQEVEQAPQEIVPHPTPNLASDLALPDQKVAPPSPPLPQRQVATELVAHRVPSRAGRDGKSG
jgi:serine/threonine protein kinase